jgi:hypothetical protein
MHFTCRNVTVLQQRLRPDWLQHVLETSSIQSVTRTTESVLLSGIRYMQQNVKQFYFPKINTWAVFYTNVLQFNVNMKVFVTHTVF